MSRRPIPIGSFFAHDVFRMEEKPAPFTKTMKGAAPENSTHPPKPDPLAIPKRHPGHNLDGRENLGED
jgi:hypothetical protein